MSNLDRIFDKLSGHPAADNEHYLPADKPFWQILLEQKYTVEYINECITAEGDTEAVVNQLMENALEDACFIIDPVTGEIVYQIYASGDMIDINTGEVVNYNN